MIGGLSSLNYIRTTYYTKIRNAFAIKCMLYDKTFLRNLRLKTANHKYVNLIQNMKFQIHKDCLKIYIDSRYNLQSIKLVTNNNHFT